MDQNAHYGTSKPGISAMAITALVVGLVALLTSLLPIINNISFFLALLGAIFSIVGIVGCVRGKRRGTPLAIAAIVVNIAAVVLVLASQSAYSAAIDDAVSGPSVENVQTAQTDGDDSSADDQDQAKGEAETSNVDLAVGTAVTLENGLTVTLDSVQPGLTNFDGSTVTGVHVTYVNNGEESVNFNVYDWKGQDVNGVQTSPTYYSESTDDLNSGSLVAGGSVSGSVYFEGEGVKALYFSNILSDEPTASWQLA